MSSMTGMTRSPEQERQTCAAMHPFISESNGGGTSKGRDKGKCYNCGETMHLVRACWTTHGKGEDKNKRGRTRRGATAIMHERRMDGQVQVRALKT